MLRLVDIGLPVLTVLLVLAALGIIIHRTLPGWREEPDRFLRDLKDMVSYGYIIWLLVGWIPLLFLFFTPRTQSEFNIGFYWFIIYAVSWVPMAILA